jgi:putative ATP-binding cassette transporter
MSLTSAAAVVYEAGRHREPDESSRAAASWKVIPMVETVPTPSAAKTAPVAEDSLFDQLGMMRRGFMASPVRNAILGLAAGILAVIVTTAIGQIILNRWNQPFYDSLERRDLNAFLYQLLVFAQIAGALLVLNIAQTWLNQMLRIKLREGLTRDLIGEWMRPRRAFRLANAGAIGVNPDQRIHEDARHLTDLSTDLGVGLLQATILLVSFVSVLWTLSSGFAFHFRGSTFEIPGYMVWAAILYAGIASWLSWLVGRPLINLNGDRYAKEAELRFSLMRVNEHIDAISLAGGEADERRRLELDLAAVLVASRRILTAVVRLNWVTAGYGWITVVAPIVIASPVYFAGDLSFGGLMMAVGAFNQVHSSLRWFVDNIGGIADWRATLLRVAAFRTAMVRIDDMHGIEKRVQFTEIEPGRMTFDNIAIASPAGSTRLADAHVAIEAGERVVVTGEPGSGKTLFFRTLAGLWPWGEGRIGLPTADTIAFVPRTPYLPPGSLRDVLSYPLDKAVFTDTALTEALNRLGLGRLSSQLDRDARWDRELNEDDQRQLAFARLLIHKPKWVVVDDALDVLKGEARRKVFAALESDLKGSTIINIGRADRAGQFFPREIGLSIDPKGHVLAQPKIAAITSNGHAGAEAEA